jgi:hypothetical protein
MNIYNLKYFTKKQIYNYTIKNFAKKLTSFDKKEIILEQQTLIKQRYKEEFKQFEDKMQPVFNYMNYIRSPIYASILACIWANPFSITFTYLKLFSNYYLIFLTGLEGAAIFSLGLIEYYLVKFNVPDDKELVQLKMKNNAKRLIMIITFFFFLVISAVGAEKENTNASLVNVLLMNVYLYVKYSLQMGNHMGNSLYLMPRMKYVYTNMLMAICLMIIVSRKDSFVSNNIKY